MVPDAIPGDQPSDSDTNFEKAFRLSPVPMAISRVSDGTFIDVNEMYLDLFGYKREEMIGCTSRELGIISDEERATLIRSLQADGRARNIALQTRTRTGEPRYVLFSSEVLELRGAAHMLSILHDITERRRAENELREREAELLEAKRLAKLGTWSLDIQSSTFHWSEGFARVHGRGAEWRGGTLAEYLDVVHPEDRSGVEQNIRNTISFGRRMTFDHRINLPAGDVRWMNVRMDLLKAENDRPTRVRGIVQDISDRVHLEGQLRQAQKLDAVGQLAGGIAHDLNNILGVIMGHIGMAMEDVAPGHPVQESLASIKNAAQRGADLVRRIVTVSSPRVVDGGVIYPREVVTELIALLRASLPSMLTIRAEMEEVVPVVRGDSTQLHQVLMNLATNAAHAMENRSDGRLLLEVKTIRMDADAAALSADLREGHYVRITVADNGHGMDRKTLERVFEPFFTTKPAGKGTGLGLSMVHSIMRSHRGAVTVYSEVNKGTTFHLYLPVSTDAAKDLKPVSTIELTPGRGQHVLCVDDEPDLLDIVGLLLHRMGYHVTKISDPMKALQMITEAPTQFDALFSDHAMPALTGMSLAKKVLSIRPDIRIVIASGNFSDSDLHAASDIGVRTIAKPVTREDLALLMKSLIP